MLKKKRGAKRTVAFDTYLRMLSSMTDEQRRKWNQEGIRRSRMLDEEWRQHRRANIEKYLSQPDSEQTLVKGERIRGEVAFAWEIDFDADGAMTLCLRRNDGRVFRQLTVHDYNVCNRVAAKLFSEYVEEYLVNSAFRLLDATSIYAGEKVTKTNPANDRHRLVRNVSYGLENLSGKPAAVGRREGTYKDCLRREDETNALREKIVVAIQTLYSGKGLNGFRSKECRRHKGEECLSRDPEEITVRLVAAYLRISSAQQLKNELYRHELKYRQLKREALAEVIK